MVAGVVGAIKPVVTRNHSLKLGLGSGDSSSAVEHVGNDDSPMGNTGSNKGMNGTLQSGGVESQAFSKGGASSTSSLLLSAAASVGNTGPTNARATLERRIQLGGAGPVNVLNNSPFTSNYVSTTKYELWNIVPKNLWEQFHRVANIWFLIVSIFQMLPLELSPTNKYATFFPLCCVLFLTFCKDAYEDYGRRREDRHVNNQICMALDASDPHGKPVKWKDVTVGSYLLIRRDEPVPADMVLLACSNEDGVAYVDTVQLDGESSLKPKFALEETMCITETTELFDLRGHLDTEPPNQLVQSFSGVLYLQGFPRGVPIDAKGFLLRGSTIRNTSWVYGLVVFTGVDTKIVQNWRKTPSKRSRLEVTANVLLMIVFGLLLLAAAVSAMARALYVADGTVGAAMILWAWPKPDPLRDNNFLAFITFMIAYNNLIPISLYVTTDLARTFQGLRMERDPSMYHPETESSCHVKNSGLNEDLGQIEFVLTDKTGTLTENRMEFKACSINGKVYGRWDDQVGPVDYVAAVPPEHICCPLSTRALVGHTFASSPSAQSKDKPPSPTTSMAGQSGTAEGLVPPAKVLGKWDEERGAQPQNPCAAPSSGAVHTPPTRSLTRTATRKQTVAGQKDTLIDQFFFCLATCHTAIVERLPAGKSEAKTGVRSPNAAGTGPNSSSNTAAAAATGLTTPQPNQLVGTPATCVNGQLDWGPPSPRSVPPGAPSPSISGVSNLSENSSGGDPGPPPKLTLFAPVPPALAGVPRAAANDKQVSLLTVPTGTHRAAGHHHTTVDRETREIMADEKFQELVREANLAAFRSSSPDEEALVSAARDYGYFFRRKAASRLTINVRGKDQYYQVLICNEFSSERKRMSVLIQRVDAPTAHEAEAREEKAQDPRIAMMERNITPSATFNPGTVGNLPEVNSSDDESDEEPQVGAYPAILYAKGADNVMLERLSPTTPGVKLAKRHMKNFASQGLRTLLLARREFTPNEVDNFVKKMNEAKGAFMNRDSMMEAVANEMERDMQLLGVTAVEDRIQEGVPETVNMLLRAGVKVWMLTGDNMETAINIGLACKLVEPSMSLYKLDASGGDVAAEAVWKRLDGYYVEISKKLRAEREIGDFKYCLVLHGKVLYTIMDESQVRLRQLFLAIACSSCSVVACRLAPAQKAALVKLVRGSVIGNPVTLAIGDGGNDASMIQEANVGVGILGVEGRQAANAADFTIGQFRFLQSLLFVHGRWNLRRISIIIGYSFYKNFLLVLPLAFYAPYNGFSGTPLYESYLLATFNLAFTSLPVMIFGIFDIDVSAHMALLVPSLYQLGINKRYFNPWMLLGWIARGVVHSILLSITMHLVAEGWPAGPDAADQLVIGSWAYGACVSVANLILLVHMKAWMDWGVIVLCASVLFFLPVLCLYSDGALFMARMFEPQMVGVASVLFGNVRSCLGLIMVTAACGLSDLAFLSCRKWYAPDVADLLQEVQLGHLSGHEKVPGQAWSQLLESGGAIEDCLRLLPSPPTRVHQVKPEGRVGLKPLRTDNKQRTVGRWRRGDDWKLDSVVPIGNAGEPGHKHTHDMHPTNSSSLIFYPESFLERFWYWLQDACITLWRKQWCEMTVTELAGGIGYDRIEVSKHFKSAIRSSMSEGGRRVHEADTPPAGRRSSYVDRNNSEPIMRRNSSSSWMPAIAHAPSGRTLVSSEELTTRENLSTAGEDLGLCLTSPRRNESGDVVPQQQEIPSEGTTQEVVQDLRYSILTLRFMSPAQEAAFKQFLSKQAARLFRMCLASLVVAIFMWFFYELLIRRKVSPADMIVALGCLPGSATIACFLRTQAFESRAEWIIVLVVTTGIVSKHVYDIFQGYSGLLFNSYFPVFIIAGLLVRYTFIFAVLVYHMTLLFVRYWILPQTFPLRSDQALLTDAGHLPSQYFVLMLGISCLSSHYAYMLEKIVRKEFFVLDSIFRSKSQALDILNGMFPKEVVDHVLMKVRREEGMRKLQEDRGIVSILFCDIYDFDGITQSLKPMELVQLLDLLWMLFDRLCERHGTVKIETVGKTYMAAALPPDGVNATEEQHAKDAAACVLMAIGMLGLVSKRFTGIGTITHVDVRIGIHTGRVLSGVVGSTKPQFALFGDTVNTASRMQSTGKSGCLHVSNTTYGLLKKDSRFEWRGKETEVKGKGVMDTYFLTRYHSEMEEGNHHTSAKRAKSKQPKGRQAQSSKTSSSCSKGPDINVAEHDFASATELCGEGIAEVDESSPTVTTIPKTSDPPARIRQSPTAAKAAAAAVAATGVATAAAASSDPSAAASRVRKGPADQSVGAANSPMNARVEAMDDGAVADRTAAGRAEPGCAQTSDEAPAPPPSPPHPPPPPAAPEGPAPVAEMSGAADNAVAAAAEVVNVVRPTAHFGDVDGSPDLGEGTMSPGSCVVDDVDSERPSLPLRARVIGEEKVPSYHTVDPPSILMPPEEESRDLGRHSTKKYTMDSGTRSLSAVSNALSAEQSEWGGTQQGNIEANIEESSVMQHDMAQDIAGLTNENLELRGMMLTLFTHPDRPMKKQGSLLAAPLLWRRNNGYPCCWRGCGGRNGSSIRLRQSPLFSQWVSFVAFWVCYSAESLCVALGDQVPEGNRAFSLGCRLGYTILGLIFNLFMFTVGRTSRWGVRMTTFTAAAYADLIAVMAFVGFVCAYVSNIYMYGGDQHNGAFWMVYEGFFFVMGMMHLCRLNPTAMVPLALCLISVISIITYVGVLGGGFFANGLLLEALSSGLFLFLMHTVWNMWDPRRYSKDHKVMCEEHERVSELLDSMLPKEVLAEMKSGNLSLAYSYEDMTFLFADIVGFTQYCATHSGEQAVNLVTRLFAEFDHEAVRLGIYKVCTIGDAYVVVNEPRTQLLDKYIDCKSVFNMAVYMLQTIAEVRVEVNHEGLDMRIGLHVGRFVGGVIGTKRLRFDVWGEDVLIGNNVESHGIAGNVCVSQTARDVLDEGQMVDVDFTFNKDISLKTGRIVRTYVCHPRDGGSFGG